MQSREPDAASGPDCLVHYDSHRQVCLKHSDAHMSVCGSVPVVNHDRHDLKDQHEVYGDDGPEGSAGLHRVLQLVECEHDPQAYEDAQMV